MRSKALVKYLNRATCFEEDIEFSSVILKATTSGDLAEPDSERLFRHVEPAEHPRLAKTKVNDGNRRKVVGHLQQTLYAAHIKDLYEDFVSYLDEIVQSIGRQGFEPRALRGEFKAVVPASELVACQSLGAVRRLTNVAVRTRLKQMGTHSTIEFLDKRIGLQFDSAVMREALIYIDLRHLLVHEDGRADQRFCDSHPEYLASPGRTVKLDAQVSRDAQRAYTAFVEHIDDRAVSQRMLADSDLQ